MGRQHTTTQAQAVRKAWRKAKRPRACLRITPNGTLERCEDRGEGFWEIQTDARTAAEENAFVPPLPPRPRNLGIYAVDLRREERRSGVPAWFMANASRRRRAHAWTHDSPHRWVQYVAHRMRILYAGILGHARLEVTLYLPEGEPYDVHADAVWALLFDVQ